MENDKIRFCINLLALLKYNGINKFSYEDLNDIIGSKVQNGGNYLFLLISSLDNEYIIVESDIVTINIENVSNIVNKINQEERLLLEDIVLTYKNSLPSAINSEQFTLLLLAVLSNNNISFLPSNYNTTIEEIFTVNKWIHKFECFLDLNDIPVSEFNKNISKNIENYLHDSKKQMSYDFINNLIMIPFSVEEKRYVLSKFDNMTISKMNKLVTLLHTLPGYKQGLNILEKEHQERQRVRKIGNSFVKY